MLNKKYICPVCGFAELDDAPYDDLGYASYDICPSCGTQFGYDDSNSSYIALREKWICSGMKWWSSSQEAPDHWNPKKQLDQLKTLSD